MKILLLMVIGIMVSACSSNVVKERESQETQAQLEKQQRDIMVRNLRLFHDKN